MHRNRLLLPVATLAFCGGLHGQEPPRATATAITIAPTIDGRLDDGAWSGAEILTDFVQREPTEGQPVSERTEVRMVYDEEALYVGAWLFDRTPSAAVLGRTLRDASLSDSDAFVVVLDTYLDRQNAFVFGTTPAGIEYDGQVTNEGQGAAGGGRFGTGGARQQRGSGGGFNLNWDGSWEVATSTDELGWYAEMRIPFATLRYGSGGAQTWGANFERRIRRNNEESTWAPIPRQFNLYRVSMAGTLALQAPEKRVLTISPYVLSDAFKDYTVASPDGSLDPRVGGDAKIGLNQSLTLDLTVNTDFAQAEVDDQQVNLTRFSLFFPEKRAFFLENAGTFAVGSSRSAELFFSRRIGLASGQEVPILAGARLTGKVGNTQIGVLNIQTSDLSVLDPATGLDQEVAPDNNFGVVRLFQEFSNRSRIGGIFVSRVNTRSNDDHNLTYGLDGRLGVGQDLTFDGWVGLTTTPPPTGQPDTRVGFNHGEYGFNAAGQYVTRDWEVSTGYRRIGSDFNPEVGFLNRRAYRHLNTRVLRHVRTENVSWFREFRPHVSWTQFWSLGGFNESYLVHIDNHASFENGSLISAPGFNLTGEGLEEPFEIREGIVIPPGSYDNIEWIMRANTNPSAPLSFAAGATWGGFYTGRQFAPDASVAYRFRDRFAASLRVTYFDVDLDLPSEANGGRFETAILALNASYSFTPRIYLQTSVQYNDDSEDIGTNIRFGWLDTAGTGFFLVYNDTEYLGVMDPHGFRKGPRQRQLVLKYTRLLDATR
jgi:hypothetical protein